MCHKLSFGLLVIVIWEFILKQNIIQIVLQKIVESNSNS